MGRYTLAIYTRFASARVSGLIAKFSLPALLTIASRLMRRIWIVDTVTVDTGTWIAGINVSRGYFPITECALVSRVTVTFEAAFRTLTGALMTRVGYAVIDLTVGTRVARFTRAHVAAGLVVTCTVFTRT